MEETGGAAVDGGVSWERKVADLLHLQMKTFSLAASDFLSCVIFCDEG